MTVYNMPIWLRNYTYRTIQQYYTDEQDQIQKASNKTSTPPPPTYVTKARK